MSVPRKKLRLSVQAKVLGVVVGFLVLLPVAAVWVVNDSLNRQVRDEARQTLEIAEAVFVRSLDARAGNLLSRYQNITGEARFKVTAGISDAKTMARLLHDVMANSPGEHEVLLYSTQADGLLAGERREPAPANASFAEAAAAITAAAFAGESAAGSVLVEQRLYNVVAIPVTNEGGAVLGVLTAGVRLGADAFRELRLPHTEVLLAIGGRLAASSLERPSGGGDALQRLVEHGIAPDVEGGRSFSVEVNDEHFLAVAGDYQGRRARAGVHYVLLSSTEPRLRALEETRRTLLGLSLAGIVLSVFGVSWLVRRVTRPLRELNESAEAVGRGDFSRKIERFSNDEVGDLAQEFNRMTANLQTSRAELERAMQTVKTTQSQLVQSEKLSAVGQFVAGVAHELNNPLTAVIGFSELLQTMPADEKIHGHLERIAKSAHRCHKIVQSLLSFARQRPPERKLVRLESVLEEVLELMAYDLRTSGITVVNLLSNARQAMAPAQREGRIIIRAFVAEGMLRLEFQDDGPGIRSDHLARIFDPFFTTKPVGQGTGLGLSLCYGIIQEHGGRISARSEPGHGATFQIDLPVSRAEGTDALFRSASSAPPFPTPAEGEHTILVIDDERWILDLAEELLRADGYVVDTALGGERAQELLAIKRYSVIVSDWKMPGLNGVRLFEHLSATNPAAAKHVIFMTGDVVSDTFQNFLKQHALTCLSKPFAIGEFRAAVARMLRTGDSESTRVT
jgi:signal transduction histidine kinase/ActR/RegA family two-component response regulator